MSLQVLDLTDSSLTVHNNMTGYPIINFSSLTEEHILRHEIERLQQLKQSQGVVLRGKMYRYVHTLN